MIAIEFTALLLFIAVATIVVTRSFVKHSKKNDSLVKTLDTIFYKKKN